MTLHRPELGAVFDRLLAPCALRAAALTLDDGLPASLHPAEAALVARAVPKRVRELAAGRLLARRLLGELGFPAAPLLAGPDRAPAWPEGAVGSITHTNTLCVVAVGRAQEVRAVGIDLEERRPLREALWPTVLTASEAERLRAVPPGARGERAMVIFSAKEAVYKYQYPFTRTLLDFQDVALELEPNTGVFRATILHPAGGDVPGSLEGRFALGDGWIATGLAAPR